MTESSFYQAGEADTPLQFSHPSFESATRQEWIVTNGLGGYASSTPCGANTRRYHGLLVAALQPPTDRRLMVLKTEEALLFDDDRRLELSANQYAGAVYPHGYRYLKEFERTPLPRAVYEAEGRRLEKTVFMRHGANTTVVEYRNTGKHRTKLELNPLYVFRSYHSLFREDAAFDFYFEKTENRQFKIHATYGAPPLHVSFTRGHFYEQRNWYRHLEYTEEQQRGLEYREDAYSLGVINVDLRPGESMSLVFSTEAPLGRIDPAHWKKTEIERLQHLAPSSVRNDFLRDLIVSGNQFLVKRQSTGSDTLIAGYPWFTDWGRDTMIAMRGLTIATGKRDISKSIIRTFLQYLDKGMIPNRFPDEGQTPEYNTIDATLWLFVALYEYYIRFKDLNFIIEVMPALLEIIEAHHRGTRYGIHVTGEGLLCGGEEGIQLTWMDAKVGESVVTPRTGCPVEVNALWYNALEIFRFFSRESGIKEDAFEGLSNRVKESFRQHFLNEDGYLNDVVIPGSYTDSSIRPNQIYACSLPFTPLTKPEIESILEVVDTHLYTPYGLRSLAPNHPAFKAVYEGNPWERDHAYHQGTVWPFLWGEYALAYLKYHEFSKSACREIGEKAGPLRRHFYRDAGLCALSEIFDGATPETGKGCIQQAWSAGMLLRVFMDERWKETG